MINTGSVHLQLAQKVAERFGVFDCVEAVAVAGSLVTGTTDQDSDIDLYIYTTELIPVADREAIVAELGASRADMNLQFWDLGDEWFDAETGIEVDVMFWDPQWIEAQVDRVLIHHQASVGFSTCHWGTVKNSHVLFDCNGWFQSLQDKATRPYPEELRRAVIEKNYPLLRDVIPAYLHQIEKAIQRNDLVSINHRVAAFLASYFDIIFALNRVPHPGEKRMVQKALSLCEKVPANMSTQVNGVLQAAGSITENLVTQIHDLVDGLDVLVS
jgi:predicted nucleotidyltransferase